MEYKGKLYAKLGYDKYIELEETSDDFDKLKAENKGLKGKLSKIDLSLINNFKKWQKDNPDKDYQYDEIGEFVAEQGRGNIYSFFDSISSCI